MQYRPEIDGLRAVAVLPVILYHAGYDAFSGGFVGVDVFFVISGYLITSIIARGIGEGRFSLADFYIRRARRILPALWLVVLACIPAALVLMSPDHLARFGASALSLVPFGSNFYFWLTTDYFSPGGEYLPLLHTWSLAVEEQFYLLFPLFLMVVLPRSRRAAVILLAGACLASLALATVLSHKAPAANYFLLPSRTFELGAGALVALVVGSRPIGGRWLANLATGVGLCLIGAAVFMFDSETPFPGPAALLPVIGTCLIIVFAGRGDVVGWLLGQRAFVLVGLVSYSAYLWHQPLFVFARFAQHAGGGVPNYPALIVATFVLAWLTWRWVETPLRSAAIIPHRRALPALAGAVILGAGFGGATVATQGFSAARTPIAAQVLARTAAYSPRREDCHTRGETYRRPESACRYFVDAPAWATFGDSHTVELGYALARRLEPLGQGIYHYSFSNCAPRYGQVDRLDGCSRWTHEAAAYILGQPDITTVVVSYRINGYLFGDHLQNYPALPDRRSPAGRAAAWASYVAVLQAFVDGGKRVVLVLQAPELPAPVGYMLRRQADPSGAIDGVPRDWWEARRAFVTQRLAEIPSGVIIVDPADILCDRRVCRVSDGDIFFYFDENHLSIAGMDRVSRAILEAAPVQ